MTSPVKAVMELYHDRAPSEARKRGSGGGSPRKYDDLLWEPRFGSLTVNVSFDSMNKLAESSQMIRDCEVDISITIKVICSKHI
jgi:hypothetical protein